MLQSYPLAVVERATRADSGIPAECEYLNLAQIKKHLERWAKEDWQQRKRAAPRQLSFEPPPPSAEANARVAASAQEVKRILRDSLQSMRDLEREQRNAESEARILAIEAGSKPVWDRDYKPSDALLKANQRKAQWDVAMARLPYRDD